MLHHFLHDGAEAGDGAGTQIIPVTETTRQDHQIDPLQIVVLVPQLYGFLTEDIRYGVVRILVAIGTREANNTGFHARSTLAMS
jgi:hypothetical protein